MIERDDRFRESVGLPTPSLDELRAMKGLNQIRGASRKSFLTRVGVIERRRPTYRRDSRDYDRDRSSGAYERRRRSVSLSVCLCIHVCLSVCLSVLSE